MKTLPLSKLQTLIKFKAQNQLEVLPRALYHAQLRQLFVALDEHGKPDLNLDSHVEGLEMELSNVKGAIDRCTQWIAHPMDGKQPMDYRSSIKDDVHTYDWDSGYEGYTPVKSASIGTQVDSKGKVSTKNTWSHTPKYMTADGKEKLHYVLFESPAEDDHDNASESMLDDLTQEHINYDSMDYHGDMSSEDFMLANPHLAVGMSIQDIKQMEYANEDREFDKLCEQLSESLEGRLEHIKTTDCEHIMLTTGGIETTDNEWL